MYATLDADVVAKIGEAQITGNDVTTTYKLLVGDVTITTLGNAGGVNNTATDLATAWNASTHPYCTGITASTSADKVILTADTAGVDYTVTSAVSGGAGTIGAFTVTTSNGGPNDLQDADNWSDGVVPNAGDTAHLEASAVNAVWGLDFSSDPPDEWVIQRTFTGDLGLLSTKFGTDAEANTFSSTRKHEYRQAYLLSPGSDITINRKNDFTSKTGSRRIKISTKSAACNIRVHTCNANPRDKDEGFPTVMLLGNHASCHLYVYEAPGGVGVAIQGDETAVFGDVFIGSDAGTNTTVSFGLQADVAEWSQGGGLATAYATGPNGINTLRLSGGELTTYGADEIVTAYITGSTYYPNHYVAAGVEITTLNIDGGVVDTTRSTEPRTFTTVNLIRGAIKRNRNHVTITTLNVGDTDRAPEQVTVEAA